MTVFKLLSKTLFCCSARNTLSQTFGKSKGDRQTPDPAFNASARHKAQTGQRRISVGRPKNCLASGCYDVEEARTRLGKFFAAGREHACFEEVPGQREACADIGSGDARRAALGQKCRQ